MDLNSIFEILHSQYHIIGLFFIVAIIYSSVGFGGGSSYLAILSLSSLSFIHIRVIALLCNIVVVSGGTYLYFRNGYLDWKKVLPIVLFSVPLAFFGGYMRITQHVFYVILGFVLITAAVLVWIPKHYTPRTSTFPDLARVKNSAIGGLIGFVSGVVGIGGGVFLSPTLHLSNWGDTKKIAATCSFFILINSIAGLSGQFISNASSQLSLFDKPLIVILLFAVFVGGQIGSRLSSNHLSPLLIKRITSILILIVGIRLVISNYG